MTPMQVGETAIHDCGHVINSAGRSPKRETLYLVICAVSDPEGGGLAIWQRFIQTACVQQEIDCKMPSDSRYIQRA
jgi:hypothetical protein